MKIEIINVSKSFGEKKLFDNFNEVIGSGEKIILLGDSGCGKTTLLNMIGTIESYDGKILYDDKEIIRKKDQRKLLSEEIGFVFQNYGLIENETVYENFDVVRKLDKLSSIKKREAVNEVLSKVNMGDKGDQKVYELSGGEQQRVALAKVMIKGCKLVLADEPTASVDEMNRKLIMSYLDEINQNGSTVVIVTHDKRLIDETTRVVLL